MFFYKYPSLFTIFPTHGRLKCVFDEFQTISRGVYVEFYVKMDLLRVIFFDLNNIKLTFS